MIDLHSHTNQSDGTYTPLELLQEAQRVGIGTLAITDHDTFAGYEIAAPLAAAFGIRLLCGIELSLKFEGHSLHVLGYFPDVSGVEALNQWILELQASRRVRNENLIARLQSMGIDIALEEVQTQGRGLAGRPHFAQLLLKKGYVASLQEAFDVYLAEGASAYVDRMEPTVEAGVRRIREAGGIASLAHPIRLKSDLAAALPLLCAAGLNAIEVYHSDHTPSHVAEYSACAERFNLLMTGGSDFHGATKPDIRLGSGRNGNLCIPDALLSTWPSFPVPIAAFK